MKEEVPINVQALTLTSEASTSDGVQPHLLHKWLLGSPTKGNSWVVQSLQVPQEGIPESSGEKA